jgi:hypothetical protein
MATVPPPDSTPGEIVPGIDTPAPTELPSPGAPEPEITAPTPDYDAPDPGSPGIGFEMPNPD